MRLLIPNGTIDLTWPREDNKALREMQRQAMEWTHIVRNRKRWTRSTAAMAQQDKQALELLKGLGLTEHDRKLLGNAGRVRVCVPYLKDEEALWEARILPWEYILSAGTRDIRTNSLYVSRWLETTGAAPKLRPKLSVLFVESAPGPLQDEWDFDDERRLVAVNTGHVATGRDPGFHVLKRTTRASLASALAELKPDIVHLAGFDNHQGLQLAKDARARAAPDGYLISSEGGTTRRKRPSTSTAATLGVRPDLDPVPALELSTIFAEAGHRPAFVFCNMWNSAARVAPLLVAQGAGAAIGFQDSIDDALAELFLGSFYRHFATSRDVDAAFDAGWRAVREQPKPIHGTGIVLWRGGAKAAVAAVAAERAVAVQPLLSDKVRAEQLSDTFSFSIEPVGEVSYALLHNNRDLFNRFIIRNLSPLRIDDVRVFVELHVGEGTYPFRESYSMNGPVLDLQAKIRVALTSELARSLDELLRTSLFVEVKWGERLLFSRTFPVTLAPVDLWADTDTDRLFLPSFVFPRDVAVTRILKEAERYVTALRDDTTAGFDGYQAIVADDENPADNVDNQVQAVWYALTYNVPVSYINPPPTYSIASQRIRVPNEVVGGGFGTCIDLALLLASCLEAVEIYPVIFLLKDHAFPGYWRTDAAHDAFIERVNKMSEDARDGTERGAGASKGPSEPWYFEQQLLREIRREVVANNLIPLESVGLTGRSSFADAITDSKEYFSDAENFDSMLDIQSARDNKVTPIPMRPRQRSS